MFENFSHLFLQQYWWVIIATLAGFLVFLLFVQGGQTLIYTLGKNEVERSIIVNVLGRKWEVTFTTLVTFGGAFFASFPLFYSTSFGGAYWLWMIILFCFIIQAISYEFRSKPKNFLGKRTYDIFLFINGSIGTILLGVAVATLFTGAYFSVNTMNITDLTNPTISQWQNQWHGLEAIFNLHNLSLGLAVFFLARVLAMQYFVKNIDEPSVIARIKKRFIYNSIIFVVFFLVFVIWLMLIPGLGYNPVNFEVTSIPNKYFHNLIEMPVIGGLFVVGVLLVLGGIGMSIFTEKDSGIAFSGAGTVITVIMLFLLAGFNQTAFYPSTFNPQMSLTIENSSSSHYTLVTMGYVSLFVPVVIGYIYLVWRSLNNKKLDADEVSADTHAY